MFTETEGGRSLTYAQALYEGVSQEMDADDSVFVCGLGVDDPIGIYGTTLDLHKKFGSDRSFDTPLAEDCITGMITGAAMAGMRPIHVHQRMDFLLLCMNQLINMSAKTSYITSGAASVPLVVRSVIGRSWGQGAQHSQALHSFFMHVPGLKVVAPTTPHDAKGCLIAAIRDNNPVIFVEHRMLYKNQGIVPEASYEVPFGKARILKKGKDITIVAISHMVVESLRAAHLLEEVGISAEVIDPISLSPLDIDTIAGSAGETTRLLVVDNGWLSCGASAEIITQIIERPEGNRLTAVKRSGFLQTPCPTTRVLENIFYPDSKSIALDAYRLVKGDTAEDWVPVIDQAPEISEFKGPF